MKKNIINLIDKITDSLQKNQLGIHFLSSSLGIVSQVCNQNKTTIKNHEGYWFRHNNGLANPLGQRLRLRPNTLRPQFYKDSDFAMRQKWWFRFYTPQEGHFIVDVGAGMGEDVHVFSEAVHKSGHVLAIEAHPATCKVLSLFVKLNKIRNVEIQNIAVSDTQGALWMSSLPDADWQCNKIASYKISENDVKIDSKRLDDIPLLAKRDVIDFMKVNIEGAEVMALNGARSTLMKTRNICVCCHDFLGPDTQTKDRVCRILSDAGFQITLIDTNAPPYERDFVYGSK